MAFEAVGQEQVVECRVAFEGDAEHLVRLAFVPGGARVDTDRGGQGGGLVRDRRTQEEAAEGRQGRDVGRDAEARARFVDRAQPVEVGAAEPVAGGLQGGDPGRRRDVDRQDLVRLLGRGVRTEEFPDVGGQPADRGHRPSPEPSDGGRTKPLCSAAAEGRPVPYRSPSDSRAIFSWSLRMPWRSASGRGGQPGT